MVLQCGWVYGLFRFIELSFIQILHDKFWPILLVALSLLNPLIARFKLLRFLEGSGDSLLRYWLFHCEVVDRRLVCLACLRWDDGAWLCNCMLVLIVVDTSRLRARIEHVLFLWLRLWRLQSYFHFWIYLNCSTFLPWSDICISSLNFIWLFE